MSATVIIPTTGNPVVRESIESVLAQSYEDTHCYLICDGRENYGKTKVISDEYMGNDKFHVAYLPINVGANGFYGHRVYASFTHLINTDYVLYLDQDNWFTQDHVESCIDALKSENKPWAFSLRNIFENDTFVCQDNCESLGFYPGFQGQNHIDTNCYCLKTGIAKLIAQYWHGGWGQDRVFYAAINNLWGHGACSGKYTVNYRLGGNTGSVKKEFFEFGNKKMFQTYNGDYPWKKKT